MASKYDVAYYSSFNSASDFFCKKSFREKRLLLYADAAARTNFFDRGSRKNSSRVLFAVRSFRSGEAVGATYLTGRQSVTMPPSRTGVVVTERFTGAALVKIRRAVENSETHLRYFCTLTFSPSLLHPWHFDENGLIRHDYAKYKLKKFLNTCSVKQKRLKRELNYIWVAENHKNGNIHFHILWDQFFPVQWLTKIWSQANNSVDIVSMSNAEHAACYMRKYITKDNESPISGNRYNITKGLRETMKPKSIEKIVDMSVDDLKEDNSPLTAAHEILQALKEDIEQRGGTVWAGGFSVPKGRSEKEYKDKHGKIKKRKGVDPRLRSHILGALIVPPDDKTPF